MTMLKTTYKKNINELIKITTYSSYSQFIKIKFLLVCMKFTKKKSKLKEKNTGVYFDRKKA